MACFVVPMAEAIVMTVVQKAAEKKEKRVAGLPQAEVPLEASPKLTWSRKFGWLNKMLWGGSLLLALEHIWHGEVVPWPPFLTAMYNPGDIGPMLHEMAVFGTAMAVAVTFVWAVIVLVADRKAHAAVQELSAKN